MTMDHEHVSTNELFKAVQDGSLSRRELLARAGSVGLAGSSLSILLAAGGASIAKADTRRSSPKVGGTMRLAVAFGATSSLDPMVAPPGQEDTFRNENVFSLLWKFDRHAKVVPDLVAEAHSNPTATQWTIRIRSGVTFHDGSPLTADDVIYSLRREINRKTKSEDGATFTMLNPHGMHKLDNLTVRLDLNYPYSILPEQFATAKSCSIIKNGTTDFIHPNGTGPFMFVSQNSDKLVLKRNPHYFEEGLPHLDMVVLSNVQDSVAAYNGLQSGSFDAIYPPPSFPEAASAHSNPKLQVVYNKTGRFLPLSMNIAKAPFSDPRARLALKLAADRTEMNRVSYGGLGYLGNDMFGLFDPGYPHDVPQRKFDPEKAKSLWKAAGLEGHTVQLWVAANMWPAQVSSALAYSQQAKQAGINIQVKQTTAANYFTVAYGIKPFVDDYWGVYPILNLWSLEFLKTSSYYSICHFETARATSLYNQAVRETNVGKRNEMAGEMNRIFHNEGPYVLWAFENDPDIYSSRIGGAEPNAAYNLNGFHLQDYYIKG